MTDPTPDPTREEMALEIARAAQNARGGIVAKMLAARQQSGASNPEIIHVVSVLAADAALALREEIETEIEADELAEIISMAIARLVYIIIARSDGVPKEEAMKILDRP